MKYPPHTSLTYACVVIGHENGNTLGVLRNLGEIGICPELVLVNNTFNYIHKCKYIDTLHISQSAEEGLEYIIDKYTKQSEKTFIFTDSDSIIALLDRNRNRLQEKFLFFGSEIGLSNYFQKQKLCELAESVGLKYPKTEIVKVGELPSTLSYPIFSKSEDSITLDNWKCNAFICNDENDLKKAYKQIKGKTILLQEFVDKENEFMLQGVSTNDGQDVYIPIQGQFYRLPNKSYGSYMHFDACTRQDLVSKVQKMLAKVKFNGVFETEFLQGRDGNLYFLEINFRQTAWTHAFTTMGVNFHEIFIRSMLLGRLDIGNSHIKKEPFNHISEIDDYHSYVSTGKMRMQEWIKDIKNADSFQFWNKKDKMPFVYIISHLIANKLSYIFRIKKR